jgi:iron uptake system component EfeO
MGRPPLPAGLIAIATGLLVLFVAACGSSDPKLNETTPQAKAAIAQYRAVLEDDAEELVEATRRLMLKIEANDRPRSESRYAATRVFYGHVLPAVARFGDLDSRIDSLPSEAPASELAGFHRIEKALWEEGTTKGMTPVARQLLSDVEEVQRRVKSADLRAGQIAASANDLLGEVSSSTIAGKEEPYAHIDLVDISARVEGAQAAFEAAKPSFPSEDSDLVKEVEKGFEKVYAPQEQFGFAARRPDQPRPQEPGIIFVIYDELSQEALDEIGRPVEALAELFTELPQE